MCYLYWKVIRENGFVPYLRGCRISEVPLLEVYLYIKKRSNKMLRESYFSGKESHLIRESQVGHL